MKTSVFSDAMGMIDIRYIEEASFYGKTAKTVWLKRLSAAAACLLTAAAIAVPILLHDNKTVTENEPMGELTLESAINDKTFGSLFPSHILEGYEPEYPPGIHGTGSDRILYAKFYNDEIGDEMIMIVGSKEWFKKRVPESAELDTVIYHEGLTVTGSCIYIEGEDNIVSYSFTTRDIAEIDGFYDMVGSAAG